MNKCIQGRYLLRAGPDFNARFIGVVAKAQELCGVTIHGFVAMSSHWHCLATYDDPQQMAMFHCYLGTNVSKEAGKLHNWPDSIFTRRYGHVELSGEAAMDRARLKYLLSQGCKEGLVASPLDWPGPSSTWSLVSGEPLMGEWVDWTAFAKAVEEGEDVAEDDFIDRLEVKLSPVQSMTHVSAEDYRRFILEIVQEVEGETAAMHRAAGTSPLGADWVLSQDPHYRPVKEPERRPRPWCHALDPEIRKAIKEALLFIALKYREAADRLKGGDRQARFPVFTFPPGLPFVTPSPESLAPPRTVELLEPG